MADEPNAFSNHFDRTQIQQLIQAGNLYMAAPEAGRPQEAPPLPKHWVDRDEDLDRVGTQLASGEAVVVTGPAGIGKSSLAAMLAGLLESRFPDGQLYIDLGADDPKSAMRSVLSRLGVSKDFLQDSFSGMVSQYRTRTRDKALLVVVDEAPDRETGLQFAPASSRAGFLLIGPSWPDDLDVLRHEMNALSAAHGTDLLARFCPELTQAQAAQYIAESDWTPAKIRALAGYVRTFGRAVELQPTTRRAITDYSTAELVEATGQMLGASAEWLHGLLLHLPGDGIDGGLLRALSAETEFRELVDAQLATQTGPERWRIEGQAAEGVAIQYRDALPRAIAWYRTRAQHADAEVMGGRMRLVDLDPTLKARLPEAEADGFAADQGLPWLLDHRRTLTGLVRTAAVAGRADEAVLIAEALWALFTNVPFPEEAAACYRTAAEAATGPIAKARMLICLGRVLVDLDRGDESEAALRAAVAVAEAAGGTTGSTLACSALEQLGWLHYRQRQYAAAETTYRSALALAESLDRDRSRALLHKLLGFVYRDQGRSGEAQAEFALALPLFEKRNDERNTAEVEFELALQPLSVEKAEQAIAVMKRRNLERAAADASARLGERIGGADGRRWIEAALEVYDRVGHPEADRLRALL
ncbi:tetratricopeptide repeat protein [Glycomyces sp. NPDC047369]